MKTFFVVNPHSANGQTGRQWPKLWSKLQQQLPDAAFALTTGPMDAALLARRALKDGAQCVVAVGGDGTVNEVVNGFFDGDQVINADAALAVFPQGTGGDFRRTFGWGKGVDELLTRLRSTQSTPLDLGELTYTAHDGSTQKRRFANVCGFGVSGLVDQQANTTSKALGGKLSFMWASFKALLKYTAKPVRYSVDGAAFEEALVSNLAVCNGRFFGGGMMVSPHAQVSDGQLEITLWNDIGLNGFLLKQHAIYNGSHIKWPATRVVGCRELRAESTEEVLIDCDGEQPGRLPCSMRVLPSAIRVKA